jgi:hypothetical protein
MRRLQGVTTKVEFYSIEEEERSKRLISGLPFGRANSGKLLRSSSFAYLKVRIIPRVLKLA